jgi:nucleoside-diphosphate-sugar epimerase
MRVLITGAGGFFGRALVRQFALAGEEVVAADIMDPDEFAPRPDTPAVTYVQLDVADESQWTPARTGPVQGIVQAAALTPTLDEMKEEPRKLVNVNLNGTLHALNFAQEHGIEKFLFISSAGVYDQFTDTTLHETDADGGFSLYGSAKLAAEIMTWRYAEMFGFDAGAVRPTSMYGPAEEFRGTRPFVTEIKTLVDAATSDTAVRIEGHDARCDWIFVDDVAQAAYDFFAAGMHSRAFNLSSGNPRLFSEVVGAVQGVFGLTVDDASETVIDGNPNRPTVISPAAYKKEFGWQPPSLENGLQRYADALQQ